MQLFYTPDITGNLYTFSQEESRHAVQVLRLDCGDTVHLVDGRGGLYSARIVDASPKGCSVEVIDCQRDYGKLPYRLWMAVAPTKNIDRFEWFLEKATEIGADRFTALLCDRSERKIVKQERSQKVVLSAVKQSLKAFMPQVDELVRFDDFLAGDFDGYQKFIAHCCDDFVREEFSAVVEAGHDVVVLIGAEGDFSPSEIERAYAKGFRGISLGSSRLRTETAALMATAVVAIKNQ